MPNRYRALAADYDETLASGGTIAAAVIEGLRRVKASGRRLVLVTGRELEDLGRVCHEIAIFDRVVAENGAVVYRPDTREERLLTGAPSIALVDLLQRRGVRPLSIGRAIIATDRSHNDLVMQAIHELRLELQVILNRHSLMVLPAGVDKARGLVAALEELEIPPSNVVGIGDAENDAVFLSVCGCGIAVANAIPAIREAADFVASFSNGTGVLEVAEHLLSSDLGTIGGGRQRPS